MELAGAEMSIRGTCLFPHFGQSCWRRHHQGLASHDETYPSLQRPQMYSTVRGPAFLSEDGEPEDLLTLPLTPAPPCLEGSALFCSATAAAAAATAAAECCA